MCFGWVGAQTTFCWNWLVVSGSPLKGWVVYFFVGLMWLMHSMHSASFGVVFLCFFSFLDFWCWDDLCFFDIYDVRHVILFASSVSAGCQLEIRPMDLVVWPGGWSFGTESHFFSLATFPRYQCECALICKLSLDTWCIACCFHHWAKARLTISLSHAIEEQSHQQQKHH